MDYQNLVVDFASRTAINLKSLKDLRESQPDAEIYEVTQLINSMLGLLVFPKEKYFEQLPLIPFNELESNGWAIPKLESGCEIKNLRELIRFLRNAITHCNLEFLSNDGSEIIGLCVWNKNKNGE